MRFGTFKKHTLGYCLILIFWISYCLKIVECRVLLFNIFSNVSYDFLGLLSWSTVDRAVVTYPSFVASLCRTAMTVTGETSYFLMGVTYYNDSCNILIVNYDLYFIYILFSYLTSRRWTSTSCIVFTVHSLSDSR